MSMAGRRIIDEPPIQVQYSMLSVPLNSSKITSSMRLPVSIRDVARIVERPAFFDVAL